MRVASVPSVESTKEAHEKARYHVTATEIRTRLGLSCREKCEPGGACVCDVMIHRALRKQT